MQSASRKLSVSDARAVHSNTHVIRLYAARILRETVSVQLNATVTVFRRIPWKNTFDGLSKFDTSMNIIDASTHRIDTSEGITLCAGAIQNATACPVGNAKRKYTALGSEHMLRVRLKSAHVALTRFYQTGFVRRTYVSNMCSVNTIIRTCTRNDEAVVVWCGCGVKIVDTVVNTT